MEPDDAGPVVESERLRRLATIEHATVQESARVFCSLGCPRGEGGLVTAWDALMEIPAMSPWKALAMLNPFLVRRGRSVATAAADSGIAAALVTRCAEGALAWKRRNPTQESLWRALAARVERYALDPDGQLLLLECASRALSWPAFEVYYERRWRAVSQAQVRTALVALPHDGELYRFLATFVWRGVAPPVGVALRKVLWPALSRRHGTAGGAPI